MGPAEPSQINVTEHYFGGVVCAFHSDLEWKQALKHWNFLRNKYSLF